MARGPRVGILSKRLRRFFAELRGGRWGSGGSPVADGLFVQLKTCGWTKSTWHRFETMVETAVVCWYLRWGIIIPRFLRWCEMDFVHPQYVVHTCHVKIEPPFHGKHRGLWTRIPKGHQHGKPKRKTEGENLTMTHWSAEYDHFCSIPKKERKKKQIKTKTRSK